MNYQQHVANSAAIRAEIQRFESVHPNIYSIYELLERVEEPLLQNQIREHVIAIEGKDGGVYIWERRKAPHGTRAPHDHLLLLDSGKPGFEPENKLTKLN